MHLVPKEMDLDAYGLRSSQVQVAVPPKLFGASGCHASQCGQHQGCLGKDGFCQTFSNYILKPYS